MRLRLSYKKHDMKKLPTCVIFTLLLLLGSSPASGQLTVFREIAVGVNQTLITGSGAPRQLGFQLGINSQLSIPLRIR